MESGYFNVRETCEDEGRQHEEVDREVDHHHAEHLLVHPRPPRSVVPDISSPHIKVFIRDWNVHVLQAMPQQLQLSGFLDVVSSKDLDSHDGHQMEVEQNKKCCEGLSQCQTSVQSVGRKDRMMRI